MSKKNADVLIIGGGPVGLMTSILLKDKKPQLNIQVIELRAENTRKQILIVDDNFYKIIPEKVKEMIWGKGNKGCYVFAPSKDRFMRCYVNKTSTIPFASASIDVLQNAFMTYAKTIGVKVHTPPAGKMEYVKFNPKKNIVTFKKSKDSNPIKLHYKYLIGADGKNSTVREKVLATEYVNQKKDFDAQTGVYLLKLKHAKTYEKPTSKNESKTTQHRVRLFVTQDNNGYIGIALSNDEYKSLNNKNIKSKKELPERIQHTMDRYLKLYGYNSSDVEIVSGSAFEIDLFKAKNVAEKIGDGYHFIVGDAAFNIHFFTGSGLNLGISTAQCLVEKILQMDDHDVSFTKIKTEYSECVSKYAKEALNRSVAVAIPFEEHIQKCENYTKGQLESIAQKYEVRYTGLNKNDLCYKIGHLLKRKSRNLRKSRKSHTRRYQSPRKPRKTNKRKTRKNQSPKKPQKTNKRNPRRKQSPQKPRKRTPKKKKPANFFVQFFDFLF